MNCDGSGRYIGCPGCYVCEPEQAAIDEMRSSLFAAARRRNPQGRIPAPSGALAADEPDDVWHQLSYDDPRY